MSALLTKTDPARRRIGPAIIVGLIGGFFSAIVKFGWEVPFPPRTPGIRSETNPPQSMLEWFGMSHDTSHTMVTFNNNPAPIMSFCVHFAFAIVFALIYCVIAEYYPAIKLWQGRRLRCLRVRRRSRRRHAAAWLGAESLPVGGWRADLVRALLGVLRAHHLAVEHRGGAPRYPQPDHA